MFKTPILIVSLVLSHPAMSSMAYARVTIKSKSYCPNEAGSCAYRTAQARSGWDSELAAETAARRSRFVLEVSSGPYQCRYQGGPKSPITC